MTEFEKVNQRLFNSSLDMLSDSQFLGWVAMSLQEQDTELGNYCARRLDIIALRIGAEEASDGQDAD